MSRVRHLVVAAAVAGFACTTVVPLRYQPQSGAPSSSAAPLVSVGVFQDARDASYGADWLGAVRGGVGNRWRTLRSDQPGARIVAEAFADGLRARGLYADPAQGKYLLEGTIVVLDCNWYFGYEAHAHVDVRVTELASHALVYSQKWGANEGEAGIWGASAESLRTLAEKTLSKLVDEVLDAPKFREAIR